ncbi:MAG: outer membrane protein assembly factor BamB [Kiritimatiellia bacterium]|jgi:outer membrane protein assembly factor BamB
MRILTLTALALGAAACSSAEVHLDYQSTLWSETRGLVLHDEGDLGHAAMWDTTCEFDVNTGEVTGDVDLPTNSESVLDTLDGKVLARSSQGLHTVAGTQWLQGQDVALNTLTGAMTHAGPVALIRDGDACDVLWTATGASQTLACGLDAQLAADRATGNVFVTSQGELTLVTPDDVTHLASDVGQGAWNATTGQFYAASADGLTLAALDTDGAEMWTMDLSDSVRSMDDLGTRGGVAVVTNGNDLYLIDDIGQVRAHDRMPSPADITVSNDGRNLALVLPDQANFFDINDGPKRITFYTDTPAENPFAD